MSKGIYKAIADAMQDIQPIAKASRNTQQGFQFRGIDQVMNELNPILTKHRIFVYPEVINTERSERQTGKGSILLYSILTIKYHFAHEDGSEICVTVVGEGMDSGDKASNKAMAIGMKYACLQMFCIPTEDMPDPDAETPPASSRVIDGSKGYNYNPQNNCHGQNNNNRPPMTPGYMTPQKGIKPLPNSDPQKEAIGKAIGEIFATKNTSGEFYFNKSKKEAERVIYDNAPTLNVVKMQFERLQKELADLQAKDMKSIPFGDDHPHFEDDIPETKESEIPIF